MKFLCLAYGAEEDWKVLSKEKQDELLAADDVLRKRGATIGVVEPGTIVRAWNGKPETSPAPLAPADTPFVGFSLIEARDLEEAIALVAKTPCAVAKGAIEVWPLRDLG